MATPDDPPGTESQPVWRPGEWMQSPFAAETPERRPAPIAPEVALAPAARLAARADLAGCLLAVGGLIVSWLASRDSASAGPTLLTLVVALVALAALSVAVGV